jgi:hypothetical protein
MREKSANGCMVGAEGLRRSIKSEHEAWWHAVDAVPREFAP